MSKKKQQIAPLGKMFALLTKKYINVFSAKLNDLPIERYFYPFWIVSQNDGIINSKILAESLQIDKVLVVRILKYLEEKNFVERRMHPIDKRSFLIYVTPLGKKHTKTIEKAMIETDQEFTNYLDPGNRDVILTGITNLANSVGSMEGDRIVLDYKRLNK